MAFRRCHLRAFREELRQSRSCRDRDPQLPLAAGLAEGEARYDATEAALAAAPPITVPAITMEGDANGAPHPEPAAYRARFTGRYEHRLISGGIGHNLPQEAPAAFAAATLAVSRMA